MLENQERDEDLIFTTKIIFVPYWINRIIVRNNLNYIDLVDHDKIGKYLSFDDTGSLIVINQNLRFLDQGDSQNCKTAEPINYYNTNPSDYILNGWKKSPNFTHQKERYIEALMCNPDEVIQSIAIRLKTPNGSNYLPIDDCGETYYDKKIGSDNNIYIVMKEGFLDKNAISSHNFFSSILKDLYSLYPQWLVNKRSPIFKRYILGILATPKI